MVGSELSKNWPAVARHHHGPVFSWHPGRLAMALVDAVHPNDAVLLGQAGQEKIDMNDTVINKTRGELNKLRDEAREKVVAYVAGGLGLIAGLAWNDAIHTLIDVLFPFSKESLVAKFTYATILTLVVVAVLFYLNKLFKKKDQ